MPDKSTWLRRVDEFLGDIDMDADLSDRDYLEVMDNINVRADSAAAAKREELGDDEL